MRENFSNLILRHVPRIVPPPDVLVPRFEHLIDNFKGVRDGATGKFVRFEAILPTVSTKEREPNCCLPEHDCSLLKKCSSCVTSVFLFSGDTLFKHSLVKAADNVLEHLKKGCLCDPDPRKVQLFHHAGRTKDGFDKVRSARGSSRNEGYHQRLLHLLGAFNLSPLMTHYILLLQNYRRNHRMAGTFSFHGVSSTLTCSVGNMAEMTHSEVGGWGRADLVWLAQPIFPELFRFAFFFLGWFSSSSPRHAVRTPRVLQPQSG